jgi:5'-deoxynucleotidase YfbR-like HD superfamily hydrolase
MSVMFTFTGQIDLARPRASDVCIEDIAHALAAENRFNGATKRPYSVAQHSWYVSHLVPREDALSGLLHDATEAYVKDLHRPLKLIVQRSYAPIEAAVWCAIAKQFRLELDLPTSVKHADEVVLATEIRDLIRPSDLRDETLAALPCPMAGEIVAVDPMTAEELFLERFYELRGAHRLHQWNVLG